MFFRKLYREEHAAAGVFMILFILLVLLGFSAIVVDAGILYSSRRQMVTAADAGALAGAKEMERAIGVQDKSSIELKAKQIAVDTAIMNGAQGEVTAQIIRMSIELENGSFSERDVIQVNVKTNEKMIFANFLGISNSDVAASAVATWGVVQQVRGGHLLPIFLTREAYEAGINYIHDGKVVIDGVELESQRGFINLDPAWNGKPPILKAVEGEPTQINMRIGDLFTGEEGLAQSVIPAVEKRMITANSLPTQLEREGFMYGLVPIADYVKKETGKEYYSIEEFVVFEILDVIVGSEVPQPKDPIGSIHALLTSDYRSVGSGNAKVYRPSENNGVLYEKGTIIGRLTGEVRQLHVVIQDNDQEVDESTMNAARYSKLIK